VVSYGEYYNTKISEARSKIERLSDDEVLQINTDEMVRSFAEKHQLPLILKDETRSITAEPANRRSVYEDDGNLDFRRWSAIRVSYPIKHSDKIEESLQYTPIWLTALEVFEDYEEGSIIIELARRVSGEPLKDDEVLRKIGYLEENIIRKNQEIQSGNESIVNALTRFIENMKTAIRNDLSKPRASQEQRRKKEDGDDDWDDDKHERTPNDDRSDTSNPNNPAYDDARDNRADQLNPNNPRYQGD
jgi:hypothetical protein